MSLAPVLVLLTCLVGSVSYIGAVTQSALVTMVLPLVLLVGLAALRVRSRPLTGSVLLILLAGAGGEVVNVISGHFQGSVARSAAVAALATGAAVVLSGTKRPASFLLPVVGIVGWALALGAGGRVELVAVVTGALGLLALAAVEREARAYARLPRLAVSALLAMLIVVAAGVFVATYQLGHDHRQTASPFRHSLATTIEPPAILSLTHRPPPSATQPEPPAASAPVIAASSHHNRLRAVLSGLRWFVMALVLAGAVAVVLRLVWVALAWRRLRSRLRRRVTPVEAGAWAWAVASLDRLGSPLPTSMSPDVAMAHASSSQPHLKGLAAAVTPALFGPPHPHSSASNVWDSADAVSAAAWSTAKGLDRVRARWRRPPASLRSH